MWLCLRPAARRGSTGSHRSQSRPVACIPRSPCAHPRGDRAVRSPAAGFSREPVARSLPRRAPALVPTAACHSGSPPRHCAAHAKSGTCRPLLRSRVSASPPHLCVAACSRPTQQRSLHTEIIGTVLDTNKVVHFVSRVPNIRRAQWALHVTSTSSSRRPHAFVHPHYATLGCRETPEGGPGDRAVQRAEWGLGVLYFQKTNKPPRISRLRRTPHVYTRSGYGPQRSGYGPQRSACAPTFGLHPLSYVGLRLKT